MCFLIYVIKVFPRHFVSPSDTYTIEKRISLELFQKNSKKFSSVKICPFFKRLTPTLYAKDAGDEIKKGCHVNSFKLLYHIKIRNSIVFELISIKTVALIG